MSPSRNPAHGTDIGARLYREALDRGLSQDEASELLGISQATFSRWVQRQALPKSSYWTKIGRFLKIPRDEVARIVNDDRQADTTEERLTRIETGLMELREAVEDLARRRR